MSSAQQPTSGPVDPEQFQAYIAHQEQQNAQLRAQIQQLVQQQSLAQSAHGAPHHQHHAQDEAVHHSEYSRLARSLKPSEFTGHTEENPSTWLQQTDTYFDITGVHDPHVRIRVVGMFLKKAALEWWSMYQRTMGANVTWDAFKVALMARFRPVDVGKIARAKLNGLNQKGCKGLWDYTERFMRFMEHITDMGVADQIDRYRQGLLPALQRELAQKDPQTLAEIISLATRVDIVDRQINSHLHSRFTNYTAQPNRTGYQAPRAQGSSGGAQSSTSSPMELGNVNNNGRVPNLSKEDYDRLRGENKCFRCKKTGHIARHCPNVKQQGGQFRKPQGRVNAVDETDQEGEEESHEAVERLNSQPQ